MFNKIVYLIIFLVLFIIGFFYIIKNEIYYSPLWILYSKQLCFIILNFYKIILKMNENYEMQLKYFSYGLLTSSLFSFLTSGGINSILLSTSFFALTNNFLMFLKEDSHLIYFFIIFAYLVLSLTANFFNSTYFIFFCLHYLLLFDNFNKYVLFFTFLALICQIIFFWCWLDEKISKKIIYTIIIVILNLVLTIFYFKNKRQNKKEIKEYNSNIDSKFNDEMKNNNIDLNIKEEKEYNKLKIYGNIFNLLLFIAPFLLIILFLENNYKPVEEADDSNLLYLLIPISIILFIIIFLLCLSNKHYKEMEGMKNNSNINLNIYIKKENNKSIDLQLHFLILFVLYIKTNGFQCIELFIIILSISIEFLLELSNNNFFNKENASYLFFVFCCILFFITINFFPDIEDYIDIPDICQLMQKENEKNIFECKKYKKNKYMNLIYYLFLIFKLINL